MTKPTDAETFADRLNNDEISFADLCAEMQVVGMHSFRLYWPWLDNGYKLIVGDFCTYIKNDPVRYVFPDGTVIVKAHYKWDFEGDTLFSFKG